MRERPTAHGLGSATSLTDNPEKTPPHHAGQLGPAPGGGGSHEGQRRCRRSATSPGRCVHPRPAADPGPRGGGRRHRLAGADRLHHRPRPPACRRHRPKRGHHRPDEADDHALGRFRGGLTTTIHLACDGKARPLAILVTPDQHHDSICAHPLLERILVPRSGLGGPRCRPDRLIAEAYSSRGFRAYLQRRGIAHTIREDRHFLRSGGHPRVIPALGKIRLKTDPGYAALPSGPSS
ncbi:transposase [Streptomyces sp. 205]|uniref:Transposase n=1 Tax=Streptomyces coffeae TaxID=621382 RepID=A0ABS1NP54_9ACTN|nr:transposase [Streptomyces coffeae]